MSTYLQKFAGAGAAGTPLPPWSSTFFSMLSCFTGMSVLGLVHAKIVVPDLHHPLLVAPFGAMSVLLFSALPAPPSQPYNAIIGNCIGAFTGVLVVTVMSALGQEKMFWLSGALSVAFTILLQEVTNSQHPPGGATALLYALVMPLHSEAWFYVLVPSALGSVILVAWATLFNNLMPAKQYPQHWWPIPSPAPLEEAREQVLVPGEGKEPSVRAPSACCRYITKLRGLGKEPGARPKFTETLYSFLGSLVGVSALGLFHNYVASQFLHLPTLVPAFGAMAVLCFSLSKAPLSQPINALFGNTIGGAVGVLTVYALTPLGLGKCFWLLGALSVSLTIGIQERTKTVHPPGGATALLFTITPPMQHLTGWLYILSPALLGTVIIVLMAVVMNNLSPNRAYPQRWGWDDAPAYKEVPKTEVVEAKEIEMPLVEEAPPEPVEEIQEPEPTPAPEKVPTPIPELDDLPPPPAPAPIQPPKPPQKAAPFGCGCFFSKQLPTRE